LDSNVMVLVYV